MATKKKSGASVSKAAVIGNAAVGDQVLIRTVTMYQLGKIERVEGDLVVLTNGGWAADIGRFGEALATGKLNEFERAPSWFAVGRGAIVDVWPWPHEIPAATK